MLIVGLTGSIGMGKTTVAEHIASRGVPVLDSDAVVHRLYEGEAVPHIEAAFPQTTAGGAVDRARLAAAALAAPDGFARLEALVHPLVRKAQWRFLREQMAAGAPLCVLDIPLLFETGGDKLVDVSLVVSAPEAVQSERVLARPGMTAEKLAAIRARQMPDAEKRARASYVIDTGLPLDETKAEVDKLLESLKNRAGDKFALWRALYEGGPGDA
jgi:dephospho-CoA kinase